MTHQLIDKNTGRVKELAPNDIIDPMEGRCPSCGEKLKEKVIKKSKRMFDRSVKSKECVKCGYAEYVPSEFERAVMDGNFDNETFI